VATESDHPSRGLAVAGSWWLLTLVVLGVYLVSPVRDATDADPAFAPLDPTALRSEHVPTALRRRTVALGSIYDLAQAPPDWELKAVFFMDHIESG